MIFDIHEQVRDEIDGQWSGRENEWSNKQIPEALLPHKIIPTWNEFLAVPEASESPKMADMNIDGSRMRESKCWDDDDTFRCTDRENRSEPVMI